MLTASSRIWTLVAMSVCYGTFFYSKLHSNILFFIVCIKLSSSFSFYYYYIPWEFFTHTLADDPWWRLRDNKSLQVSRTLFENLADFNNSVVWMVSIHPPIFNSSSPLCKPLWIILSVPIQLVLPSTSCSTDFLVIWQGFSTFLSFNFLWFSLCGLLGRQSPQDEVFFFFFFDYH